MGLTVGSPGQLKNGKDYLNPYMNRTRKVFPHQEENFHGIFIAKLQKIEDPK
jgi:hypothetical protein